MQLLFKVHVIDQQWSSGIYLRYQIMLKIIENILNRILNFYKVDKHTFAKLFNYFVRLIFVQYRCPGITDMKVTWTEITKSMKTLPGDIKKNAATKQHRLSMKAQQNRQQSAIPIPTSDLASPQADSVEKEQME